MTSTALINKEFNVRQSSTFNNAHSSSSQQTSNDYSFNAYPVKQEKQEQQIIQLQQQYEITEPHQEQQQHEIREPHQEQQQHEITERHQEQQQHEITELHQQEQTTILQQQPKIKPWQQQITMSQQRPIIRPSQQQQQQQQQQCQWTNEIQNNSTVMKHQQLEKNYLQDTTNIVKSKTLIKSTMAKTNNEVSNAVQNLNSAIDKFKKHNLVVQYADIINLHLQKFKTNKTLILLQVLEIIEKHKGN